MAGAGVIYSVSGGFGGRSNPDFPEGHPYVCRECKHVTILSNDELFELKAKARESQDLDPGRVTCAECGSENTFPAVKCPRCGEYSMRTGARQPVCPHCEEPFPSLFDD